jgi:Bacterial Ig-like domain (group 2)
MRPTETYTADRSRLAAWLVFVALVLPSLSFAADKLAISPSNPRQLSHSSLQFGVALRGHDMSDHVRWTSSNPVVATIGRDGQATLLSPGTTTISARLGEGEQRAATLLTVTTAANPVFSEQPTDTNVSALIDPGTGVRVQLRDNLGDPLPGESITVNIGTNPPGTATLSGRLRQVTDATGTATFPNLKIDWLGTGYTLVASANPSSGPVSGTSAAFNELRVGDPCLGPDTPVCSSGCANLSGDGLNDAWKIAGGIDLNGDGKIDPRHDFLFPLRAQHQFSDVSFTGSGNLQMFPTVTDATLPIASSNVVVKMVTSGDIGVATFEYSVDSGPEVGPFIAAPVVDVGQNLRLMFYQGGTGLTSNSGDTYNFSTSMGPEVKVVDTSVPTVFVQYDYMDYDVPGAACSVDSDCYAGGAQPNNVCRAGACTHSHYPGDPLFRKVVDQFAAHGITLYIDPVHRAIPHARVMTWSKPGDGTLGAKAACAGADVVSGNIGPGQLAVSFFDVKNRPGSDFALDPLRKSVFHYTVFSHAHTCLTDTPGVPGSCKSCPADRSTPAGFAFATSTGTAELPGNDFIVALGPILNDGSAPLNPFLEAGVFMHELGHNLGLHHAGDLAVPENAPNYLSVMNYRYTFTGITHAAIPGSRVPVEGLRELNYSEHELNTLNEASLDEQAGVSPSTSGYTGIVRFWNGFGANSAGPEAGPVDWSGNSFIDGGPVSVDLNLLNAATETMAGYRDWDHDAVDGGSCTRSVDCRINAIRLNIHNNIDSTIDVHEPCVLGRCQSLWLPSQCTQWSKKD